MLPEANTRPVQGIDESDQRRDYITDYKNAKTKEDKEKLVQEMAGEINALSTKVETLQTCFKDMEMQCRSLQEDVERNKSYYKRVIKYVSTQVEAFYDAISQATGGSTNA